MTATITDLKDIVKVALGTPETVNFKALHKLLTGILSHLWLLEKHCDLPGLRGKKKATSVDGRRSEGSSETGAPMERSLSNLRDDDQEPKDTLSTSTPKQKRKSTRYYRDEPSEDKEEPKRKDTPLRRSLKETTPRQRRESSTRKTGQRKSSTSDKATLGPSRSNSATRVDKPGRGSRKSAIRKMSGPGEKVTGKPSRVGEEGETSTSRASQGKADSGATEDAAAEAEKKASEEDELQLKDAEEAEAEAVVATPEEEEKHEDEEPPEKEKSKTGSDLTEDGVEMVDDDEEEEEEEEETEEEEDAQETVQEAAQKDAPETAKKEDVGGANMGESQPMEFTQGSSVITIPSGADFSSSSQLTTSKPSTCTKEEDQATARALEEMLQRVVTLENDLEKVKRENQALKGSIAASSSGSSGSSEKDLSQLEKKEKILQKHIEMVERETDDRVANIWKDLKEIRNQLQHLPNPKELHKSLYPSWKMLEDGICAAPTLKENIEEGKRGTEKGQALPTSKQVSKFLGSPGPSDRLIDSLATLGRLVEQSRAGCYDQLHLASQVAQAKTSVSSKKTGAGMKYPVEGRAFQKEVASQEDQEDAATSVEQTDSIHQEVGGKSSVTKVESGSKVGADSGYMNFKMTKLVEEILGIRKELDDMQLWKDRLVDCQNDLKDLAEMLLTLKREMDANEEKDHDILASLQMDMNELQLELCGMESKKAIQARREEMDSIKTSVQDSRYTTLGDVVIDREARIRTQQLQLQLNALHHMVAEIECRLPDLTCGSAPVGLPTEMQHPWGTGRAGVGTNMRAGVGTTAAAVVAPNSQKSGGWSSPSSSPRPTSDARPTPLGGGGSEETPKVTTDPKLPRKTPAEDTNDNLQTQFAIIRLNQGQSTLAGQVEACQNQQNSEIRRIQDLMTRMHREYMIRCASMQEQLSSLLGEKMEESEGSGTEMRSPREGESAAKTTDGSCQLMPVGEVSEPSISEQLMSASGRRESGGLGGIHDTRSRLNMELLMGLRREMMGYIDSLKRRIQELESTCLMASPDTDPALLKKPVLHHFQCLSCDKWIDITQPRIDERMPASSVPELPRLPMLTSPPRIRNASKSHRVSAKPLDVYEIPRQCGGSYTASNKPRRMQFYSSLGDFVTVPNKPKVGERVDVKGTDGHIYKGQVNRKNHSKTDVSPDVTHT